MIRLEALAMFSEETSQIGHHGSYMDAFPKFYMGYLINSKLKYIAKQITVNIDGDLFTLGEIEASFDREVYARKETMYGELSTTAIPVGDVLRIPHSDLHLMLLSGDVLSIKFDRPIHSEQEENPAARRSNIGSRPCHNEISESDRLVLDTMSMVASAEIFNLLASDLDKVVRKKLPSRCFDLRSPHYLTAGVDVLNVNYSGDNGEDIFVREIHSSRTKAAFSHSFGTSEEWVASRREGQHGRRPEFIPTEEEVKVLTQYNNFIKQL